MEQNMIPNAKIMATKSEPIVKKKTLRACLTIHINVF